MVGDHEYNYLYQQKLKNILLKFHIIKYIHLKRVFRCFPNFDLSIILTMDLPAEYKNTRVPEGNGSSNILIGILIALGGACAACLILGIIIRTVVSNKKKSRHENRIEIPLQISPKGNCITYDMESKFLMHSA